MRTNEYFQLVNEIQKSFKINYFCRYSDKRKTLGYRTKWWLAKDAGKLVTKINAKYGDKVIAYVHNDRYNSLCIKPIEKIVDVPKKRTWCFKEVERKWVLI